MNGNFNQLFFAIRGEPVGQSRPRFSFKTGHAYEERKSSDEKARIRAHVSEVVELNQWTTAHPDMPISIKIVSYRPIPSSKPMWFKEAARQGLVRPLTKPDCDNLIKLYLDAMNGLVYADDKQVSSVAYEAFYAEEPVTEVVVTKHFLNLGEIKKSCHTRRGSRKNNIVGDSDA